jgi:hypothetical protein
VYVGIVAHKLNITLLDNKMFAVEKKKRTDVDNVMSSHEYKMPAHNTRSGIRILIFLNM